MVLNPVHFLLLDGGGSYIHAQNDILDLAGGETGDVDVVFLGVVCQDQVLELNLDSYPLLWRQVWPDMVRLCNNGLVRREDDLCTFRMQVQRSENEDESTECSKASNGFQPVVEQVEKKHLRLSCFEDAITQLFDLQAGLKRQLELATLDDDVGEVE